MQYDPALKQILQYSHSRLVESLAGGPVRRWLNTELPEARVRRADLVAELETGSLFHLELQSTNDPQMAKRMLEYRLLIEKSHGRIPAQMVLYVGMDALTMPGLLEEQGLKYSYSVLDIREIDGGMLLRSPVLEDRILAILCRLESPAEAALKLLREIAEKQQPERGDALAKLLLISGLRQLHDVIRLEVQHMPLFEHPLENPFLRDLYFEGVEKGKAEGIAEGRAEEARRFLIHVAEHRFGALPSWARTRIETTPNDELEILLDKVLDAPDLEGALRSS